VLARGGVYSEGPIQASNFQDTYLEVALGLIGLIDIEVITVVVWYSEPTVPPRR
jgi:FMN-dependent NADH-azoreductase